MALKKIGFNHKIEEKIEQSQKEASKRLLENLFDEGELLFEDLSWNIKNSPSKESQPFSSPSKSILIADDSSVIREAMSMIVKKLGYRSVIAANGEEAIAHLKNETIAIAFCDINMPIMNGIGLLRTLKENEISQETKFIMLSTLSSRDLVIEAKKYGVHGWLIKPPKFDVIKKVLQKFS